MDDLLPRPDLTGEDLTREQRAWVPQRAWEGFEEWPCGQEAEAWGGKLHFTNTSDTWTWRSIALALRAYPGAHVALYKGSYLTVTIEEAD